jgi:hypothetical protein
LLNPSFLLEVITDAKNSRVSSSSSTALSSTCVLNVVLSIQG